MGIDIQRHGRLAVAQESRHRLFVRSLVKHHGHEIMAESVAVELPRESILVIETAQVSVERIGMYQFAAFVTRPPATAARRIPRL